MIINSKMKQKKSRVAGLRHSDRSGGICRVAEWMSRLRSTGRDCARHDAVSLPARFPENKKTAFRRFFKKLFYRVIILSLLLQLRLCFR